ncbi:putative minor capsid protein [Gracilibacillus thailandensis]|uniref:putative minor capsid protein n=1 Tax=Gracilibacillus thailandensis TaxID=563735 RepID=UPI0013D8CCA5|nr:putative minor capsid protein [Gracilibacillus thailandensis]
MRIKPIPKKLLPDTVTYKPLTGDDGWNKTYGEAQTINHVRIEPATSMNRSSNSEGVLASDLIFVDRINSSYFPTDAKAGDLINDREVTNVVKAKAFDENPHHLEMEVV